MNMKFDTKAENRDKINEIISKRFLPVKFACNTQRPETDEEEAYDWDTWEVTTDSLTKIMGIGADLVYHDIGFTEST